ncbi:MAG TPA: hypothetical protein VFX16_26235 [Pseudonocardiaceae bacterium]|nr:hypothetical protein [Pseudonocardiaceae bacterium]
MSRRWFGVPRWAWIAGLIGLIAFAAVYGPWNQPNARVRAVVNGLRTSSVYQEPGAPGLVNAARTRQVIGNRPIVVAIMNRDSLPAAGDHDPISSFCDQIAREVPADYIWVFGRDSKGGYTGNNCYGSDFPHPTKAGVSMDDFDLELNITAQLSAQYRVTDTDLTPQIEEFVLSFDAATGDDFGAVPTRGAVPDVLAVRQIVLACVGMVAGTVALFLLLRMLGLALRRRTAAAAARARRHTGLSTELNRIADAVINPRKPKDAKDAEHQADVAKRYVLALDELEHAHTDAELTKAANDIGALAEQVVG